MRVFFNVFFVRSHLNKWKLSPNSEASFRRAGLFRFPGILEGRGQRPPTGGNTLAAFIIRQASRCLCFLHLEKGSESRWTMKSLWSASVIPMDFLSEAQSVRADYNSNTHVSSEKGWTLAFSRNPTNTGDQGFFLNPGQEEQFQEMLVQTAAIMTIMFEPSQGLDDISSYPVAMTSDTRFSHEIGCPGH